MKTLAVGYIEIVNVNRLSIFEWIFNFLMRLKGPKPMYSIPLLIVASRDNIPLGTRVKIGCYFFVVVGVEHYPLDWFYNLELEGEGTTPVRPKRRDFSYQPITVVEPAEKEGPEGLLNIEDGQVEKRGS